MFSSLPYPPQISIQNAIFPRDLKKKVNFLTDSGHYTYILNNSKLHTDHLNDLINSALNRALHQL